MALDVLGLLQQVSFTAERPTVISAVAREIFVNETPLVARLARDPIADAFYNIISYDVRSRAYTVGTGGVTNVATLLPIADASPFIVGDVLEIVTTGTAERVEVVADPITGTTPNGLTVRRGREGTTGAAHSAADPITLVGNSRTGAEIDQNGARAVRSALTQYVQTFQFPVQTGGLAEALSGNTALPPGAGSSNFGLTRATKLREMMRDIEYTSYYGLGEQAAAAGDRQKQKGLKTLISSYNGGSNVKTGAGASYTRLNFIADTIQKIYNAGGLPDTVVCSTDFLTGLDTWTPGKTAYTGRMTTELGFPITEIVLPLNATPLTFVPSLQLKAGTAIVLTSSDIRMRNIRAEQWVPRGARGDSIEGDWLADMCVHIDHPMFHAWCEGITSYA